MLEEELARRTTCPLCGKTNAGGHSTGFRHQELVAEQLVLDTWLGTVRGRLRTLTPCGSNGCDLPPIPHTHPAYGETIKQAMLDHWGWDLTNLVNAAKAKWMETGVIYHKQKYLLTEKTQLSLAIVN